MLAGYGYQHDLVGRIELAHPMNDSDAQQLPARLRLLNNLRDRALGHARVMFQFHGCHIARFVQVTHQSNKCCHGTNGRLVGAQTS